MQSCYTKEATGGPTRYNFKFLYSHITQGCTRGPTRYNFKFLYSHCIQGCTRGQIIFDISFYTVMLHNDVLGD